MMDELWEIQKQLDSIIDRLEAMTASEDGLDEREYIGSVLYWYAMRRGEKSNSGFDNDLPSALAIPGMIEFGRDGVYSDYLYGDDPAYHEFNNYMFRMLKARVEGKPFDEKEEPPPPRDEPTLEQEQKAEFMWALRTMLRASDLDVPPPKRSIGLLYWPVLRYLNRHDSYIGEFWKKRRFEHPSKAIDRTKPKRWMAALMVGQLRLDDPGNNPASKGSPNSVYAKVGSKLGMSESSVERAYRELKEDVEIALSPN